MKPILEIKNISKKYTIGGQAKKYLTLRDSLTSFMKGAGKKNEDFWALNDVNFDVNQSDAIGIIGNNGAGKSTLLKILSRITPPTSGKIITRGRIASLLEVGTGFHAELTGRENVFLNGSILGLKKGEIINKFDAIVDFAGVEKFIDTPLKHYSSGMQLRLAFAVAAYLEPEILAIDEVLAVGDVQFQEKCLKKMDEVSQRGTTILFVSHNMSTVSQLCNKAVYLDAGKTNGLISINEAINFYNNRIVANEVVFEDKMLKAIRVEIVDGAIELHATYDASIILNIPNLGFAISDIYGQPILGTNLLQSKLSSHPTSVKKGKIKVLIKSPFLANGTYRLTVWFGDSKQNFVSEFDCLTFELMNTNVAFHKNAKVEGTVIPVCEWSFE